MSDTMKKVSKEMKSFGNISKKLDSPLAKYNSDGQLICVLCNTPVKNELYWTGHVNGKSHREMLVSLKSNKRPHSTEVPKQSSEFLAPPPKKPKQVETKPPSYKEASMKENDSITVGDEFHELELEASKIRSSDSKQFEVIDSEEHKHHKYDSVTQNEALEARNKIPEGFFDDPKADAKARGVEYKDHSEAEWDQFLKEIASEEIKSMALRGYDEEEATKSRVLDEIEEQMANLQRVINLDKKAEELRARAKKSNKFRTCSSVTNLSSPSPAIAMEVNSDAEDDEEYDESLEWRSKRR